MSYYTDPRFKDLSNPTLWCFDLNKYNRLAHRLETTVFANYKNPKKNELKETLYFADKIYISTSSCLWIKDRWEFHLGEECAITAGLIVIKDKIENPEMYEEKDFFD